ncbi:hypothetical protein GX51_07799 [Blastomyces parvus]|uniref:Uncharacterized protein n=1 Tax=Blastomyces parvus TaxID=2060905 RepID=A0A2B7WIM6_9EURO|nr:hypothetical protein GX51_07799 [Blastomyces parvus]
MQNVIFDKILDIEATISVNKNSDILKMIINKKLKSVINSIYLLNDETQLITDENENSANNSDSILSTFTDCSIILVEIKRSSD